jgi:hypothetical protein
VTTTAWRRASRERRADRALAGEYNVMPTELDVYKPERWVNDALQRHSAL